VKQGFLQESSEKAKKPDFQVPLPAVFVFAKSAYFLASSTKKLPQSIIRSIGGG
jgi:hypothetical protein